MKIYETNHYFIQVDQEKNLILIRPVGFWSSSDDVSGYLPTIRQALDHELRAGFLVICDLAQMKSATKDIRDNIHAQASLEVLKRSVKATVIVSPESAITRMQIESLRKAYIDKPIKQVGTVEEAYTFLEQYR